MSPTRPVASIVPVPATTRPPTRSPGVSLSTIAEAKISPAEGPPMSPRLIRTSTGESTMFVGVTPRKPRGSPSGRAAATTATSVRGPGAPSGPRCTVTVTVWPGPGRRQGVDDLLRRRHRAAVDRDDPVAGGETARADGELSSTEPTCTAVG